MVCGLTSATIMSERGKSTRQNQALRCTSVTSRTLRSVPTLLSASSTPYQIFASRRGHSPVLAKMFSPRGYQVFQVEQAGLIQTFVESAGTRRCADMSA